MWLKSVKVHGDEFPDEDCYPFNLPIFSSNPELVFSGRVAFFVGENGSGKSTLLDAVARRCGLHIWARPKDHRVHRNPFEGSLPRFLSVEWREHSVPGGVFSAETFRQWAEFLDDVATCDPGQLKYYGGSLLTLQSHGQGLLSYFRGRYRIPGIYFLDEPEAALSPTSQLELLQLLHTFREQGHAQFVVATHSPILLALPGAQVFSFEPACIVEKPYQETEHYRFFHDFFADPSAFLTEIPPLVG